MDQRQMDIAALKQLREELVAVNELSPKLKSLTNDINKIDEAIQGADRILRGVDEPKWAGSRCINNAEKVLRECVTANNDRAERAKMTTAIVGIILNLVVLIVSVGVLATAPDSSWIKTGEYNLLFWIAHICLGLILAFIPCMKLKK